MEDTWCFCWIAGINSVKGAPSNSHNNKKERVSAIINMCVHIAHSLELTRWFVWSDQVTQKNEYYKHVCNSVGVCISLYFAHIIWAMCIFPFICRMIVCLLVCLCGVHMYIKNYPGNWSIKFLSDDDQYELIYYGWVQLYNRNHAVHCIALPCMRHRFIAFINEMIIKWH